MIAMRESSWYETPADSDVHGGGFSTNMELQGGDVYVDFIT